MSRKFLDDNIEIKNGVEFLVQNSNAYDPGHGFQDMRAGTIYVNEGTRQGGSIFGHPVVNRIDWIEDFFQFPQISTTPTATANVNFITTGTNAADAGTTFSTGGGIKYITTTAANDQAILTPHTAAKQTIWNLGAQTDNRPIFETVVQPGAAITSYIGWAGLKLTSTGTAATDADEAFFRYQDGVNGGRWQCITNDNTANVAIDSGVTVVASTRYHLKAVVDVNRFVTFFINGVQVARSAKALRTAQTLKPFVGVQTTTTAARQLEIRVLRLSKDQVD